MDRIPGNLQPAFLRAVADATTQQRAIGSEKGLAAISELKRKGLVFSPMTSADRVSVRKEMEARLWADFARQYPSTATLFAAITSARSG